MRSIGALRRPAGVGALEACAIIDLTPLSLLPPLPPPPPPPTPPPARQITHLVHLGELLLKVLLGDAGQARVDDLHYLRIRGTPSFGHASSGRAQSEANRLRERAVRQGVRGLPEGEQARASGEGEGARSVGAQTACAAADGW